MNQLSKNSIIKMPFRLYYSFGKNYSNSQSAKAILKIFQNKIRIVEKNVLYFIITVVCLNQIMEKEFFFTHH